ncbi:MAG: hypothetical protein KDB87_17050, partial [Flavobacteriales bacterium]|nr:hypothetical protein [Flavobacteriales bacterium]
HDRSSNALFAVGSYQTASAITSQAFGLPASNGMDGFLVRLNTNGQPLAKMLLTGPGDASLASVCMGPNGTLYAAGWFEGTASFISATGIQTTMSPVGSQKEAVVLAIDASGELVWSHVLGSPGDDRATGVA